MSDVAYYLVREYGRRTLTCSDLIRSVQERGTLVQVHERLRQPGMFVSDPATVLLRPGATLRHVAHECFHAWLHDQIEHGIDFDGPEWVQYDRETAAAALARHRQWQDAYIAEMGELYVDQGLVIAGETGAPACAYAVSAGFRRLVRRLGLPPVSFHKLRHSHASHLIAAGVHPKVIQERLGHATISTTMDVYGHLGAGGQDGAAELPQANGRRS